MKKTEVQRPVLRYHGGKWRIAPWIIQHMPRHNVYVEPFGGGGSVLLQKPRASAEVYNDLDGMVVNVFRVLQDPAAAATLLRRISLTPFARAEFDRTYTQPSDDVEWACYTIRRSFMGHGTDSTTRTCKTGFRSAMTDDRALPSAAWAAWPESVASFVTRLRGVVIENRPANEVIARMDGPETLFYLDPPYLTSSRSSLARRGSASHGYAHEMTDKDHADLAVQLNGIQGMAMISGYQSELYDELYRGWERIERVALADGARERVECLWFNARASSSAPMHGQLFQRCG